MKDKTALEDNICRNLHAGLPLQDGTKVIHTEPELGLLVHKLCFLHENTFQQRSISQYHRATHQFQLNVHFAHVLQLPLGILCLLILSWHLRIIHTWAIVCAQDSPISFLILFHLITSSWVHL